MFKLLGALGLILISAGVVVKNRRKQNYLFIVGGLLLESYSLWLGDPIFIILQIVFILSAIFDRLKNK